MQLFKTSFFIILTIIFGYKSYGQISPGELSKPHSHLEGMSNCTKCHTLGEKVSNEKCLECHKDLNNRISNRLGYHYSIEIRGKECITCHSEHHGLNFQMIRFDKENFDHTLTGYKLHGAHSGIKCNDCHKFDFISDESIRNKKNTFLGLDQACMSCHTDYHQNTLGNDCISCHDFKAFSPATGFKHSNAKFQLIGKHQQVECIKCHKKELKNGKEFQQFVDVAYDNCTSCHSDVHNNKFGQNCITCHSEESFHQIKDFKTFDHNLTNYILEGKHLFVNCKSCHRTKYTDPLKHERCTDCHADYHSNQFDKNGISPDCADCHTANGFLGSTFTIDRHNAGNFELKGAHMATPCFVCHKKEEKWSFKNIGSKCVDCHGNTHELYLDKKYYPDASCQNCHSNNNWSDIMFDHSQTKFILEGAHKNQLCSSCHTIKNSAGNAYQLFTALPSNCYDCHADVHNHQFEEAGYTNCKICHDPYNWKAEKFDHNTARFILDGKHENVACNKCHKIATQENITFIQYKFEDISCESCH